MSIYNFRPFIPLRMFFSQAVFRLSLEVKQGDFLTLLLSNWVRMALQDTSDIDFIIQVNNVVKIFSFLLRFLGTLCSYIPSI